MWILSEVHRKLDSIITKVNAILAIVKLLLQGGNNADVLRRIDTLEVKTLERFAVLEALLTPPPDDGLPDKYPEIVTWRQVSERKENDMWLITFEAELPEIADTPKNKDVVQHRIKVLVDGADTQTIDLPREARVATFEVEKGKTVQLKGSYVDDDGNEGPATESQTFVAADTVPPDAPGPFGAITNLGEREVVP